ncbi:MAG: TetR/AcrR family transcriptional regulator [Deltaproteobacteria bacterium]|nr:TetR/AcrR family transcriptional regulator [Deltaproteobacteria bacterium]
MTAPTESLGKTGSVRSGRAAKTRGKLLDATAELLAERGYSRLSTAAVAERAGVAHGTLFKHFPTKSALMAATTERVLEDVVGQFLGMAREFAGQPEPIDQALRAVWSLFRSERLQATLELYVAARTDEALREALRPIFTTHRSAFLSAARALLPASADESHFESNVTGILATLLGGALLWSVVPEPEFFQSELAFVDRIARAELARIESIEEDA